MIITDKLTKYYNRKSRGIEDLSLEVKEGEVFGFIGPNGAGKSTTIRTLLNLIFPTEGTASVLGFDCVKDTIEIRKNVGYIPSEVNYYNDMTVMNFLKYSTKFYTDKFKKRLNYLAEKMELDLTRKIGELSFGNKKKVAIVAAFVYEPKVLILDEPTSGLDPLMQSKFFELLEEEKKRGATIFFSSHVLSDVQRLCDRVGIIREGQLVKIETLEDIMNTRVKKVRVVSDDFIVEEDEDVVDLVKHGNNRFNFIYKGEISKLLKLLKSYSIKDLSISEPSLEEVFMHYYVKEDKDEVIN